MTTSRGGDPGAEVRDLQDEFDRAELHADAAVLERLIADDFQSIGPKGFVLDKEQWISRHSYFRYHALDTSEVDIRTYGDHTAIVRNVQRNRATHRDDEVALTVRVSQVWIRYEAAWRLVAIQFSPMG